MRVYRVEVHAWPTEDGQPWERFYGYGRYYVHDENGPDVHDDVEPPAWVLAQQANPQVADRFRLDEDGTVLGVVMPKVSRRHYLSASGARKLTADMVAFGAQAVTIASAPVLWYDDL